MSQFTELRETCDEFGLTTELALAPTESSDGGAAFELIVDFDSGPVEPEHAISTVEEEFDLALYDASASQHDHSLSGEYTLAVSA